MNAEFSLERRAALHAALADPARLAITDALCTGDASPSELGERLGMRSNLIAHHLRVLAEAGLTTRTRSEADHRRVYIRLLPEAFGALVPTSLLRAPRVVFVCTRNSARSQLAAALWRHRSPVPAVSAGTRPGERVHEGAVAVAHRHGLHLKAENTAHVQDVLRQDDLVVAVCDSAHEELPRTRARLHWSVPDPVRAGTEAAFDDAFSQISDRVERLAPAVHPEGTP
ncbi:helix-turn-helix domain-containing protein [Nocardiopsis sp. N85]|uniref:arsenate reductase/protein-tyrosine-phosphatase family protein n=1 Tax=Nocardiopsis sp. N85 TaxID=3029400 RepID=UPI00237F5024|nr:helix-turn-helix domain-containing protein [Nocardiopsis sp. N85]MDE3722782.1 helix-turn-helix domain-containing protein [Nocardiopsis sp. N85]